MNIQDEHAGSSPSILPPDDLGAKEVRWPTVLAVISMVYAGLAFIANACGAASPFLTPFALRLSGLDMGDFTMPGWLVWLTVGSGIIGLIMAIVLFTGSIALLRRRRNALGILKAWVAVTIVLTILGIGFGFVAIEPNVQLQLEMQDATLKMIKAQGGNAAGIPVKTADEMRSQSKYMLAIFGLLPMVYPVIVGFVITSRGRMSDAEAWME